MSDLWLASQSPQICCHRRGAYHALCWWPALKPQVISAKERQKYDNWNRTPNLEALVGEEISNPLKNNDFA